MFSSSEARPLGEVLDVSPPDSSTNGSETKGRIPFHIQSSLLDSGKSWLKFLNIFTNVSRRDGFSRVQTLSKLPSMRLRQITMERDEISRAVPSEEHISPFRFPFVRKINWKLLGDMCKTWFRNPMNMALFVWIVCVAVSGAILFMVMTGMLNAVLPGKSQRDEWFEICNQILNGLFTLMCLYQHPQRLYHFVLLCRWKPTDVIKLRKVYCKNGTYKPNEWMHILVVVLLLNLNCFAQYALCGLNIGYSRAKRPAIGVGITISVAFGAAASASLYCIVSPLGKDYAIEIDQEGQTQIVPSDTSRPVSIRLKSFEKKYSFAVREEEQRVLESSPKWIGGLFDIWDDISLAYISIFCLFCVFGWNMDRMGFGNMYVHIATFLLFCVAPFFIFGFAAININNEVVREILGVSGIVLCAFGLLYGGFWRIQMRKRFKLPSYTFCCGNASVTDCFQWLCCSSCSLAQEVRTVDYYEIVEDRLYIKEEILDVHATISPPLSQLEGSPLFTTSNPSSPFNNRAAQPHLFIFEASPSPPQRLSRGSPLHAHLPKIGEEPSTSQGTTMEHPNPPVIL